MKRLTVHLAVSLLLTSCGEPNTGDEPADFLVDSEVDTEAPQVEATHAFTFAVIADPHITTGLEHQERLAAAVAWLNEHTEERRLELAVVVGDVGWHGGLPIAKALLDELDVPYVPLIGDNEVHFGEAEEFGRVFTPVYESLASEVDQFVSRTVAVDDPVNGGTTWIYNLSFVHHGLRFIGMDWASRNEGAFYSETADLHDFEGGTWPWFVDQFGDMEAHDAEDVLMFSHHPMRMSFAGFDIAEFERVVGVTGPLAGRVAGAWAGHLHLSFEDTPPDAGYDVFVTDATWDDEVKVRLVEVWEANGRYTYEQELVLVAY